MRRLFSGILAAAGLLLFSLPLAGAERQLLWGDTHLHTSYSFDAFLSGNLHNDPDSAYRFAKGEPVEHPFHKVRVQLGRPLDFLVVSDHAEYLGALHRAYKDGFRTENAGFIDRILDWHRTRRMREAIDNNTGVRLFQAILPTSGDPHEAAGTWREGALDAGNVMRGTEVYFRESWDEITEAADRHNEPGKFTALIGWEWSSTPGGANLHRIVISDVEGRVARTFLPFSSLDSPYPADLWKWLDETSRATGGQFVAVPHNSNVSKGLMFADTTLRQQPLDASHARERRRWEPVVEVTQYKGDSETHPLFSPNDEFADFETYVWYIQVDEETYNPREGDYIRPALKRGLALQAHLGINPFQFGFIGSTDAHTGLATAEETNFWGKFAGDSIPSRKRGGVLRRGVTGWSMAAQGLAGVWAEDNTREAIVAAFRRREVYATTGSRITLRLIAGWDLRTADLDNFEDARRKGVPMGGVLQHDGGVTSAPVFLVQALRDPLTAPLDRLQIVKGWLDSEGRTHERIYDVTWYGKAADRRPGADGRLPPVDNNLNLRTGHHDPEAGAARLQAHWQDPQFDPAQRAFYYLRVLEVPTVRHSHLDAIALGLEKADRGAQVIQERAYSSPVWYDP